MTAKKTAAKKTSAKKTSAKKTAAKPAKQAESLAAKPRRSGRLIVARCACERPRTLRLSRRALEAAPLKCGVCKITFAEA